MARERHVLARPRPVLIVILSLFLTAAAQAQSLYLHSPSEEKTANEIRDGITAAKASHLAALDRHKTYLQEALTRERRLLTQRELAQRDEMIAVIVENQDSRGSPRDELRLQVGMRLQELTGLSADRLAEAAGPYSIADRQADIASARSRYNSALRSRDSQKSEFEGGGGTGQYCGENGLPEPVLQNAGSARLAFLNLAIACREMRRQRQVEQIAQEGLPSSVQAILGELAPGSTGSGELGEALAENANIVALATAQKAMTNAAKAHLKQLQDYYRCQQALAARPGLDVEIAQTAARIRLFTTWLTTLDEAALQGQPAATPPGDTAQPEAPPCPGNAETPPASSPGPIATIRELAESAGVNPATVAQALSAARGVSPGRALLAGIQQEAQEFQAGRLAELIGNIADYAAEGGRADDSRTARAVGATLRLIAHFEQLNSARSGTLPDTSAVLVRLAGARMRMATNKLEADRLQRVRQLSDLRVAGLRRETLDLLQTYRLLASPADSALSRALLRFADSWTRGRLPARVARNDMLRAELLTWADRERAAVEAAYGVLEPAAAELQAYGAGGIRPADIAGYLNTIGIGAIAIGGQ